MKTERFKDMPQLKREIIRYLFKQMERKAHDEWWQYKGQFEYEGEKFNLECECRWDNEMFTYRNMHIEYQQKVIDITDTPYLVD